MCYRDEDIHEHCGVKYVLDETPFGVALKILHKPTNSFVFERTLRMKNWMNLTINQFANMAIDQLKRDGFL